MSENVTEIVQISRQQAEQLKGEVDFVCVLLMDLLQHLKKWGIAHSKKVLKEYKKRTENCCCLANHLLNQFYILDIIGEPLSKGEIIVRTFQDPGPDANEEIYADGLDPYQEEEKDTDE